jgi:hypothetical protein
MLYKGFLKTATRQGLSFIPAINSKEPLSIDSFWTSFLYRSLSTTPL